MLIPLGHSCVGCRVAMASAIAGPWERSYGDCRAVRPSLAAAYPLAVAAGKLRSRNFA